MPWVPTTDFEEEVVNLQPHHDFIYGVLSEPQFSYPRPKAHTEYAANKKLQNKEQQKEYEITGKINAKLRVIQQVQQMAKTKPVGEQPSIDDWENNKQIEQETIGMMRYCGLGVSVEQPLNQEVTIATYPVENEIKVVQNGNRKVPLFFDENCFKLQPKVSDTSSSFQSFNNSGSNKVDNIKNDSLTSEQESDISFITTSSLSLNSFSVVGECSDSSSSVSSFRETLSTQRLQQYDKLLEDTGLLSLDSSISRSSNKSQTQNSDSFQTAEQTSLWKPIFGHEEDLFSKIENWPTLSKKTSACDTNSFDNKDVSNITHSNSSDNSCSETNSSNCIRRKHVIDRFIKSEDGNKSIDETTSPPQPKSYAAIAKAPQPSSKPEKKKDTSSNLITNFPTYYTTRRMYALKRNVK